MVANRHLQNSTTRVEFASCDGVDDKRKTTNTTTTSSEPPSHPSRSTSNLEFRSFWKAGGYDVHPTRPVFEQGQLEHARVHPKFLHSNATSHKWAFGAIAELLDNAVDEIYKGATFVKLDKISNTRDQTPALLFQDDGGGMDPESIRHCMSLGYSKKNKNTIGQYGNGFKTSTMRLGADVIVFSRATHGSRATQSIGLLSYTFLRRTGKDDVIVPMIDFELLGDHKQPIIYSTQDDWSHNLGNILEWSPFASEEELMLQFEDIGSHGTKIIVYNLWLNEDGLMELDFDYDDEDICLRDEVNHDKSRSKVDQIIESHISSRIRFSLRAYASILYLRKLKHFDIILRGKPVEQYNMADELKFLEVVMYKPHLEKALEQVSVKTKIGFVKEAPLLGVSGFNVYHKNRLIRPFWRVLAGSKNLGNGVVGILEANFIEPAHDKQDFERSTLFYKLETKLKQMCHDYWKTHYQLIWSMKYAQSSITRNTQKKFPTQDFNDDEADLQQEFAPDEPSSPAVNVETVHGHTSDMCNGSSNIQPIVGVAEGNQTQAKARSTWNPSESGGYPGSYGNASVNRPRSALADQISEENIQLFIRCDEHRQRQTDLKQTIKALEKELAEAKTKCSRLASYLETQKRNNRDQLIIN